MYLWVFYLSPCPAATAAGQGETLEFALTREGEFGGGGFALIRMDQRPVDTYSVPFSSGTGWYDDFEELEAVLRYHATDTDLVICMHHLALSQRGPPYQVCAQGDLLLVNPTIPPQNGTVEWFHVTSIACRDPILSVPLLTSPITVTTGDGTPLLVSEKRHVLSVQLALLEFRGSKVLCNSRYVRGPANTTKSAVHQ